VAVSARTGEGIDDLLLAVGDRLRALTNLVDLVIPFERGDLIATVHREGEVLSETTGESGMRLRARLDDAATARLAEFIA
jgi:GTP-binding protein HflX